MRKLVLKTYMVVSAVSKASAFLLLQIAMKRIPKDHLAAIFYFNINLVSKKLDLVQLDP